MDLTGRRAFSRKGEDPMGQNRHLAAAACGAAAMALLGAALLDSMPVDRCRLSDGSAVAEAGQLFCLSDCGIWQLCCLEGVGPVRAEAIRASGGDLTQVPGASENMIRRWKEYIELDTIQ